MTSDYYPSYCKSANQFPYIGRISAKSNNVDFIYQFVKHHKDKSHHMDNSKWQGQHYLTGKPTRFPNYGDFPRIFCMRTYGFNISTSPWQNEVDVYSMPQTYQDKNTGNHTDIVFHEAVYPIRVSIYEIYNPGNIIRIYAQDSDDQWHLLWDGSPQIVPPTSRLFSPPLQSCNFKTKSLRLEFKPSSWDYYTKIDAVMLIGTSKLILPRNPEESLTNLLRRINFVYLYSKNEDVHNLTTDYKKAHLDIVHLQENFHEYCIRESDLGKTYFQYNLKKVSWQVISDYIRCSQVVRFSYRCLFKYGLNSAKRMKLSSDESVELQRCHFSSLPDEIILKVLKNLDFKSLCRMSQVNERLNALTHDWSLYTCLNMQNVYLSDHTYMYNIFRYFTPRCTYLQQLDLTASEFFSGDFEKFLDNCGRHLTHLRLCKSSSVDNSHLQQISRICKNLKKLDLRYCGRINNEGYSCLENLEHLEHLSISYSFHKPTEIQTLCKILQKNQQMRELSFDCVNKLERVAMELKKSCRNLKVINLSYLTHHLISQGINALADCKNLRKITIRAFKGMLNDDSLDRLLSSCQNLEEVHLYRCLTDHNLNSLTQCKNLKKLYLYNMKHVTSDLKYSIIFEQCPKLQKLYLIDCNITKHLIKQWREKYPHVSVFVKTKTYVYYHGIEQSIDIFLM